jgi:enoyl-CoA hydratase
MNYNQLKIEIRDSIATIENHRPDKMNALNVEFFNELNVFLDNIPDEVRVLVFTGEGKAFVAGADISEMEGMSAKDAEALSLYGQKTFTRLEDLDIPVIAAVNGFALGGGCELALACDIRLASTKAKFGQPEVNLGIIPGYAGTQRLSRLVGMGNALRLIMTADMIDAEEAKCMGLVQKVIEPENLMEETYKMAKTIMSKGPNAIMKAKKVIREGIFLSYEEAFKLEAKEFGSLFDTDAIEGMKAFMEKRKPNWQK